MHIFMDETGPFSGIGQEGAVSLVGAIIVPTGRLKSLESAYARLRKTFEPEKDEVKGRKLDEKQVAKVISLLHEHSVLFAATAIDLSYHTQVGLTEFKAAQAEKLTASLTDEHPDALKQQVAEYRQRFEAFPLGLMMQTILTFEFLPKLLDQSMMYYALRRPEELGSFHWVIDAKGNEAEPNSWEEWWSTIVLVFMESRGFQRPFKRLPGADYSHLKPFEREPSEWIKKMANFEDGDPPAFDLTKIVKDDFRFSKEAEPGLELVDIITNATRRALKGHLQKNGWQQIPTLMIHSKTQYVEFSILGQDKAPTQNPPYIDVIRAFRHGGRKMIPRNKLPQVRRALKGKEPHDFI